MIGFLNFVKMHLLINQSGCALGGGDWRQRGQRDLRPRDVRPRGAAARDRARGAGGQAVKPTRRLHDGVRGHGHRPRPRPRSQAPLPR